MSRRALGSRAARLGTALAPLLVLLGACIIPTNYYERGSRRNLDDQTVATLQPGATLREEILLRFGEPDFASADGRRLGYAWTKIRVLIIIPSYGDTSFAVPKASILQMAFDDQERLTTARVVSRWRETVDPALMDTAP